MKRKVEMFEVDGGGFWLFYSLMDVDISTY